jgi:mgtE-like transporter
MKRLIDHLKILKKVKKSQHHPLIHEIHKHYRISKKTLFYVKEYGAHTNVPRTIVRESLQILILSAILSAAGGLAIENIKNVFVAIVPLVILLPMLNDMIGDFGTIISARFSAMLHEGKVKSKWWHNHELKKLFVQVFIIAMLTTVLSTAIALVISLFSDYQVTITVALKMFAITVLDVIMLIAVMFISSILLGLYYFKKKEDPNNFLIPIITSIADFANMILLAVLIMFLF